MATNRKRSTGPTPIANPVAVTALQRDLLALLEETTRVGEGPPWKPGAAYEFCDQLRRNVECRGPGVISSLRGLVLKGLLQEFGGGYRITDLGCRKVLALKERGLVR